MVRVKRFRSLTLLAFLISVSTDPVSFARASDSIALPGGAPGTGTGDSSTPFLGLASAPDTVAFTGSASTSIVIEAVPGRAEMTPALTLVYSSAGGTSPYGYGWNLSLPRIERSTRKGVPRYSGDDAFMFFVGSNPVELEVSPKHPNRYQPLVERNYERMGFDRKANAWTVIDRSGTRFRFGGRTTTRVAGGNSSEETFAWLLETMEDATGNTIDFHYLQASPGTALNGLPDFIEYGGNTKAGTTHFARVAFRWGPIDPKLPARSSFRSGLQQTFGQHLLAIETYMRDDLVRRYSFDQRRDRDSGTVGLHAVSLDALSESEALNVSPPSTVFLYSPGIAEGWPTILDGDPQHHGISFTSPGPFRDDGARVDFDLLDLNGDALVDYVTPRSNPPSYRPGNGAGFGAAQAWNWPGPREIRNTQSAGNTTNNLFDIDGDLLPDLVAGRRVQCGARDPSTWCVWKNTGNGFASEPIEWPAPLDYLRYTDEGGLWIRTDLVDLNGDGLPDLVDARYFDTRDPTPHWRVYWNNGSGFDSEAFEFAAPRARVGLVTGRRAAYGLYDMNGDGLRDFVASDTNYLDRETRWRDQPFWQVWFNTGRGFAQEEVLWRAEDASGLPNFASLRLGSAGTGADMVDINGDGLTDLVRRSDVWDERADPAFEARCGNPSCKTPEATWGTGGSAYCCYNLMVWLNTGSSFTAPLVWRSQTPGLRKSTKDCPYDVNRCFGERIWDYDLLDFNGDGLVDQLQRDWSGWRVLFHPASPQATESSIPVEERAPPHTLLGMLNGIGAATTLEYSSVASSGASPKLPFPRWVVSQRALWDGVSEQPAAFASYEYEGGRFDALDREFRGFHLVEATDLRGIVRRSRFHQDPRRKGLTYEVTLLDLNEDHPSGILGRDVWEWPDQGPLLLRSHTRTPWKAGLPLTSLSVQQSYKYDAYGNRRMAVTQTALATTTYLETVFDHDILDHKNGVPRRYRVDRPLRSWTSEDSSAGQSRHPLVEKHFDYKTNPPHSGILVSTSTCIDWDAQDECQRWSEQSFEHDAWGNVHRTRRGRGAWSTNHYDKDGRFVIEHEQPGVGSTHSQYDPRTGRVLSTIEPGGQEAHSRFDALGRLRASWGPGQSQEKPRLRRRYLDGNADGRPGVQTYEPLEGVPSAVFHDGLGRVLATKQRRLTDEGPITIVAGIQLRDRSGSVSRESLAQRSASPSLTQLLTSESDVLGWASFERDSQGRMRRVTLPDGSQTYFDRSTPGVLVRLSASLLQGEEGGSAVIRSFDGLDRKIAEDICDQAPKRDSPWACPEGSHQSRMLWYYDGLGRITETNIVDLENPSRIASTRISYDGLGNRSSATTSNGSRWDYRYDDDGRLVETIRPGGRSIRQTWDAFGRLSSQRAGRTSTTFRYHKRGGGLGKVSHILARSGGGRTTKRFEYDPRGRMVRERWSINSQGQRSRRFAFEHQYDELDRRVATTYPSPRSGETELVTTVFGEDGSPVALQSPEQEFVLDVARDLFGSIVRMDFGNGLSDRRWYAPPASSDASAGALGCLRTTIIAAQGDACSEGTDDLSRLRYTGYDADGRLLEIEDAFHARGDRVSASRSYRYDPLGRLSEARYADGYEDSFAFDSLGNLRVHGSGSFEYASPETPHQPTFFYSRAQGQPRVDLLSYDTDGNLIKRGPLSYRYDELGRLSEVFRSGELLQRRQYDEAGRIVAIYNAAERSTQLRFGTWFELENGELTRHYHLDGQRVASDVVAAPRELGGPQSTRTDEETTILFYHRDHQASALLLTDGDGAELARPRFRAFGRRYDKTRGSPEILDLPGFTGHRRETATGLLDMRGRQLDPELGLFLTPDPEQQYPSPYLLGGGNPIVGRDADGRLWNTTALSVAALLTGTATFIDSVIQTGNLGASLTAGVIATLSTYGSAQLSRSVVATRTATLPGWGRGIAGLATVGLPLSQVANNLESGRVASAIAGLTILAASITGGEQAGPPSPASVGERNYDLQGIAPADDKGVNYLFSEGICATHPGCLTNTFRALRENIRLLFGGGVACVEGCETIHKDVENILSETGKVHLECNSFGATKCLGAIQKLVGDGKALPNGVTATLTGAPLLRPPAIQGVTYRANLFDPVTWVGTIYSVPFRSDVTLGRSGLLPFPVVVHHPHFYMSDELRRIRASAGTP